MFRSRVFRTSVASAAPLMAIALLFAVGGTPSATQAQDAELIRIGGRIVDITDSTVTLETEDNRQLTYETVLSTRVSLRGRSVRLDQLEAGDVVEIVASPAEPGVALRVVARPPVPAAQPGDVVEERPEPPPEVYAALGVSVSPSPTGVYVSDVQPGSPADKVGLDAGSFILSIGDAELGSPDDLFRLLEQLKPEETVKIVAWMNGETRDMAVVLGSSAAVRDALSTAPEDPRSPPKFQMPSVLTGATLVEADAGVTATDVAPQSPAAELGLRRGDVIRSVGGELVSTTTELFDLIASLDPGAKVQIEVQRGRLQAELVLVMPSETVTVQRPAVAELPADMPAYAHTLLRQQQENEELLDSLLREVQALRAEVNALRR